MATTVVNVGVYERDTSGNRTTNKIKQFSDAGTVRAIWEGKEYVFGPGQSITFSDDGIAAGVAAFDARLRVADTREGINGAT